MATLVLGAVGGLFGGIGRAVGSILGQQIDGRLLGPKPAKGPRLSDLSFQSSSYGAPIPRVFGKVRLAGSVIWATDLQEDRRKVSTGKGRPKQTVYSYSASFAVALSARLAGRIGRIWADGKLLRGAAGDFKSQTGFRFHSGSEDQAPDPLIAASEGLGNAPAYRGLAYAVFEDLQLEPYGNRIPSISFEVIADEADVPLGQILDDILPTGFSGHGETAFPGLALAAESVSAALSDLEAVTDLTFALDDGGAAIVREGGVASGQVLRALFGATTGTAGSGVFERERGGTDQLPARMSLSYFDVARDYLEGQQSIVHPGGGAREARAAFAATLSAAGAKSLLGQKLAHLIAGREQIALQLPWSQIDLAAGDEVTLEGLAGRWRVETTVLEGMIVKAKLSRLPSIAALTHAAEAGRSLPEPDLVPGFTVLHLLDLPWLGIGLATGPAVYVAAAGSLSGWRSAALLQSTNNGLLVEEIGPTALPATIGVAQNALASGFAHGLDEIASVEIAFPHSGMVLADTDDAGLIAGRNLALIGEELIQFGRAEPLAGNRYRLTRLLRGRRGTEWAIGSHAVQEQFTLVEQDTLIPLTIPQQTPLTIYASGIGDLTEISTSLMASARAVEPPSPVHFNFRKEDDGGLLFSWIRRSRDGWRWDDLVDAPLAEQSELFRITVSSGANIIRTTDRTEPNWRYAAVDIATDVAVGATLVTIELRQIGTYAGSRPASITLTLSQT